MKTTLHFSKNNPDNIKAGKVSAFQLLLSAIFIFAFCITSNAQFTKLHDFTGSTTDGALPQGNLFYDGSFLYGMTVNGGATNDGLIFKIKKDGSQFSDMFDFNNVATGRYPHGSLISDGNYLYGMTQYGGTFTCGTVFKILPTGAGYVKLYDFDGTTNGKAPFGSLVYDGTNIYGSPQIGGASNLGTIFKINTTTNVYQKLLDYTGVAGVNPSGEPEGSLITDGTYLYGMGYNGGANNYGSVYKVKNDGTLFSNMASLTGTVGVASGSYPTQSLISDGTFLYGMTESGFFGDFGTIFKINIATNAYTKLMNFTGPNGLLPHGGLIYDGTYLYGAASGGGANNTGLLFKILPDGTGFVDLFDFAVGTATATGKAPRGDLWSDGCFLYGMTVTGGSTNKGVIYKFQYAPSPTISAVSSTSLLCSGQTATLTGSGANTYSWNPGGTGTTVVISPTVTTDYTLTATAANNCTNTTVLTQSVTICPLGINQITFNANEVNVFPNPFNDKVTIVSDGEKHTVYAYNTLGSLVFETVFETEKTEIDLSSLPKGIYYLQIKSANNSVTKKITKQ